jgi:hypothetical protein
MANLTICLLLLFLLGTIVAICLTYSYLHAEYREQKESKHERKDNF